MIIYRSGSEESSQQWHSQVLSTSRYELTRDFEAIALSPGEVPQPGNMVLQQVSYNSADTVWTLVPGRSSPQIFINGSVLDVHIIILQDRDYIGDGRVGMYISLETLPQVKAFTTGDDKTYCVRCKTEVKDGDKAVTCPGCLLVYHEDVEIGLNCFTYSNTCVHGHPTAMNAGYKWNPDNL